MGVRVLRFTEEIVEITEGAPMNASGNVFQPLHPWTVSQPLHPENGPSMPRGTIGVQSRSLVFV